MDIRQMKYFKTIVEEGTISKAAKKLHMAQPPLSMQLKQLEEELSVILLKRGNKQIELTEAGNRFYKRCLQILDLTEITKNELKQSYQDVLRIGITSSNSGLIQQESIQEFIKKNKHVQYAIHEGSTYEILDLLFPSINQETVIEYVKPIFEALDLPLPLLTRQFIELSGGQQVRVAIASVLISNPDILILDEPFGDLDPVTLRIVANSLKKINEKLHTTIILVSHTMEFVEEVSTRTILINKGKLVNDGEPSTVTAKFLEIERQ